MKALFNTYTCKEDYEKAGVRFVIPMTAKEIEDEEAQDLALKDGGNIVEEKLDGTRATLHFFPDYARVFSRRVSEKTGWFCENSDSLPQLRDLKLPQLSGTILDGEMVIPKRPFKDVASTLNCVWEKAIQRQEELGYIVFRAFDILYYKGECIEDLPLMQRKEYLRKAVEEIASPYVEELKYYSCDRKVPLIITRTKLLKLLKSEREYCDIYPTLYSEIRNRKSKEVYAVNFFTFTPKAYYEYIVLTGGEGVMIKPKDGKYLHKRAREYQKIKKFLTREVIIMGFSEPTKEYKGKFPDDRWAYWEDCRGNKQRTDISLTTSAKALKNRGLIPVSKFYYEGWVGNIRFGVIITDEEIAKLPKSKKFNIETMVIQDHFVKVLEVGECSGFDEEMRALFSFGYYDHDGEMIAMHSKEEVESAEQADLSAIVWTGKVVEVKANELFADTGKLRHPRFLRLREDKSPLECVWANHVSSDTI